MTDARKVTRWLVVFSLAVFAVGHARADEKSLVAWRTDFTAAVAEARASNRALLVKFTGSDWCPPCRRLAAEVFDTDVMADFTASEVVPVLIDFPRTIPQTAALRRQNQSLAERYDVTGYPTVLVLSPDEQELGRLGYMEGGPKTFVRAVRRCLRPR